MYISKLEKNIISMDAVYWYYVFDVIYNISIKNSGFSLYQLQ